MNPQQSEIFKLRLVISDLLETFREEFSKVNWEEDPGKTIMLERALESVSTEGKACWLDEDPDVILPEQCVFDNGEPLENCLHAMEALNDPLGKFSCPYYRP